MTETKLLTVNQFAEKHKAFTRGCLRALIFNEKKNGFYVAILRLGGKVLIDETAFFVHLRKMNEKTIQPC